MAKVKAKNIEQDSSNRFTTDAEKAIWNGVNSVRQIAIENSLSILELQAAATLAGGVSANMVRDVFSDATGYLNTINTTNTNANFNIDKYRNNIPGSWDISTASYENKFKVVTGQTSILYSVKFSPDGTKMYVLDINHIIYQYTLSTAWDVSSASYASKSFTSNESTDTHDLAFNNDGTFLYLLANASKTVYQYTLSTAWDISTASYASKNKDVSSQASDPRDVAFNSDGTKMYILNRSAIIYQYTLSTAWDITTASYASKNKNVSSQDNNTWSFAFSYDGLKMYSVGMQNLTVYQYTLSTAWDITTASYASKYKNISSQVAYPFGMTFNPEGTKMFIANNNVATVFQYTVSGDISYGNFIIQTNTQSLVATPSYFQVFAWKKTTTGTGSITADVSFDDGSHYQTNIFLDTPTAITNTGPQLTVKINLNAGASAGEAECKGFGIMFW